MDIKDTITTLLKDGFILVFNQNKLDIVKTAEALLKAGINNMEVTCRINKPLEKLARLRKELPDFAAGTASLIDWPEMLDVYNKANPQDPLPSVQEVVDAGACYLVSAVNFSGASYKKYAGRLPIIPGCGSATEVVSQFSKGANLCKIFPAKQLGGPAFVKAIDPAIHKTISLVPTGGTNAENIGQYIDAGVPVAANRGGPRFEGDLFSYEEVVTLQQDPRVPESFIYNSHQFIPTEKGFFTPLATLRSGFAT